MILNNMKIDVIGVLCCSMLKDLLCSLGFVDAWVYQGVGNDKMFYCFKQRLTVQLYRTGILEYRTL